MVIKKNISKKVFVLTILIVLSIFLVDSVLALECATFGYYCSNQNSDYFLHGSSEDEKFCLANEILRTGSLNVPIGTCIAVDDFKRDYVERFIDYYCCEGTTGNTMPISFMSEKDLSFNKDSDCKYTNNEEDVVCDIGLSTDYTCSKGFILNTAGKCAEYADFDNDGYGIGMPNGDDCDEFESACATDCSSDLDNDNKPDCKDDCIDNDGDGYGANCDSGEDCDDSDKDINPGSAEVCNWINDDCDDQIDECPSVFNFGENEYVFDTFFQTWVNPSDYEYVEYVNSVMLNLPSIPGRIPSPRGTPIDFEQRCSRSVINQGDVSTYFRLDNGDGDPVIRCLENSLGGFETGDTAEIKQQECFYSIAEPICYVPDFDEDSFMNYTLGCPSCTDCNDNNASINPRADDLYFDGIDNNCNGFDGDSVDSDEDGIADVFDVCPHQGLAPFDVLGCWYSTFITSVWSAPAGYVNLPGWGVE